MAACEKPETSTGQKVLTSVPRTAVIVLNWNALEATAACVSMVHSWNIPGIDVIVVDNASVEHEREHLKSLKAYVLLNDTNLGYAGGNNRGIKHACDKEYEVVFLLNNDATIERTSVLSLLNTLQRSPDSAIVGPVIYDKHKEHVLNAGGLDVAIHNITHLKTPKSKSEAYRVNYISGTAALIRTSAFKNHGFLDEDYFFSCEIADFCNRLNTSCLIDPIAKATHDTMQANEFRSTLYTYYTVRNRYLYIRKNRYQQRWRYFPRWWKIHSIHACSALRFRRGSEAGMVIRGLFDGMCNKTGSI